VERRRDRREFWWRSAVTHWSGSVTSKAFNLGTWLSLLFGTAYTVWPRDTSDRPVLVPLLVLSVIALVALCHGAYLTWHEDNQRLAGYEQRLNEYVKRDTDAETRRKMSSDLQRCHQDLMKHVQRLEGATVNSLPEGLELVHREAEVVLRDLLKVADFGIETFPGQAPLWQTFRAQIPLAFNGDHRLTLDNLLNALRRRAGLVRQVHDATNPGTPMP
jgi:hypothetical protein